MDEVSLSNGHLSQDLSLVVCLKDCGWHRNGGNRNGQTININNGKTKKKKKNGKTKWRTSVLVHVGFLKTLCGF